MHCGKTFAFLQQVTMPAIPEEPDPVVREEFFPVMGNPHGKWHAWKPLEVINEFAMSYT